MPNGQFLYHFFPYMIGRDPEAIHKDPLLPMPGLDGIYDGLIGRIAIAFKPVDLRDLKFRRLQGQRCCGAVDTIGLQVEIDRITSLFESIDGFRHRIVCNHVCRI